MQTETIKEVNFTRVKSDINGNPRYVCHFLNFITDNDRRNTEGWGLKQTGILYDMAIKRANKIGGRKFHNKQYGGGIVFQMYEGEKATMTEQIYRQAYNLPDTYKVIIES